MNNFYPTVAKIGEEYRELIRNKDYRNEKLVVDKFMDEIAKLIAAERAACVAAAPENKEVNWQDISTPELVAKQSEAYGYNQGLADYKANILKRGE